MLAPETAKKPPAAEQRAGTFLSIRSIEVKSGKSHSFPRFFDVVFEVVFPTGGG